jgi:uncharacterized membrane-anchored protein YhcB (DUF1043 family)
MAGFLDAAELRRYASRTLSALASGTRLPAPVNDVPQYWLAPATKALIALHAAAANPINTTSASDSLTEAMTLDRRRTSIFLALAFAALGLRNQVRTEWLGPAFEPVAADGSLTRVQRVLWATAARGGFGAEALNLFVSRLQSLAPPVQGWLSTIENRTPTNPTTARTNPTNSANPVDSTGPANPADSARFANLANSAGFAEFPPLAGFPEVAEQEQARSRLNRIRTSIEAIAGNTEALEPDRELVYTATDGQVIDSAAQLLRLLISEGSDHEREPLARIAVLRTRLAGATESVAETLNDPIGTVEQLLRTDLHQTDDPHLAATALRVISPSILPAAEDLSSVARRPSPTEILLEIDLREIAISPDGPNRLQLEKAEDSIEDQISPLTSAQVGVPAGLAVIGALIAIGLGPLHSLWILIGLMFVAGGALLYLSAKMNNTKIRNNAQLQLADLHDRCTNATNALSTYVNTSAVRQQSITQDLAKIRHHLSTSRTTSAGSPEPTSAGVRTNTSAGKAADTPTETPAGTAAGTPTPG